MSATRHRIATLAVVACIAITIFLQQPGRLVPETKLDLVVDPVGFLRRSLHLWDGRAAFGQLPNQQAGYLFPMGPFYAIGHVAHIPMWLVQRGWMALLLIAALIGMLRVAEELAIGTATTRLVSAAAFALSPVMLTSVAFASGGLLPAALAPWALLPLLRLSHGGSPRRAAALSGLAIAAMGGINATSVLGGMGVPLLWLATRRWSRGHRRLVGWWILAVVLACLWWAIPVLLQAKYGLHFQRFTETTGQTTATTSNLTVLRGTSYWLSYLFTKGPWLRGGWELASHSLVGMATALLAAIGLAGVARRDAPERLFLGVSVAVGVAVVAAGYSGPLGSPLAGMIRTILDGPLSALRNLDKFEPILRAPLALGLGHALSKLQLAPAHAKGRRSKAWTQMGAIAGVSIATAAVAVGALPLFDGHLTAVGGFRVIPAYWRQTAAWLVGHDDGSRSLLLPGSAFGEYTWGRPLDEPLQALAGRSWAVRNLIPLGSLGTTRLLDAIESRLDDGRPDPGLADVLARAGVKHLVIRNDLDLTRVDAPGPQYIREALAVTPSLSRVASFGPIVSCGGRDRLLIRVSASDGASCHAVDVYDVDKSVTPVTLYPSTATTVISGAPESLLTLADHGMLPGGAVLAGDPDAKASGPAKSWIVTDDLRRRNQNFGALRDTYSYALTADEPAPGTRSEPQQRLVVQGIEHQSVVQMSGASRLIASSYGDLGRAPPALQPYAAFDRDPNTAWVADSPTAAAGPWIEVDLQHPLAVNTVSVRLLADGNHMRATRLTISTAQGSVDRALTDTEDPQTLIAPSGATTWIRITIASATSVGAGSSGVGIREINVPGLTVERTLVVPNDVAGPAPTFVFERARSQPDQIGLGDEEARLDRTFVTRRTDYEVSGEATPRPGPLLDQLLWPAGPVQVTVSSSWGSLPAFAGPNMLDDRSDTAWIADSRDPSPTVTISWPGARSISMIQLTPADAPTLAATHVRLSTATAVRDVPLNQQGVGHFAPVVTDHLTVTVDGSRPTPTGVRAVTGVALPALGVAQLRLPEVPDLTMAPPDPTGPVELPCGQAAPVVLDGHQFATSASGTIGDLLALHPLVLHVCGLISLAAESHHMVAGASPLLTADQLTLAPVHSVFVPPAPDRTVTPIRSSDEARTVRVGEGSSVYLALSQNFNSGWSAELNGRRLAAVRLDGWRQAWLVPGGTGGLVHMGFIPGTVYRHSLVGGLLALFVLMGLALAPGGSDPPPGGPASPPGWLMVAFALGAVAWVGGPLVLLVPVLMWLPSRANQLPLVAGIALGAAGLLAAQHGVPVPGSNAGAFGAPVQLLATLAVAALVVSLIPTPSSPGQPSAGIVRVTE